MKERIKIAFAHNNINANTQGIMAGITEYIRNKGDWQLIVWPDSSQESLLFLKQRGCKGAFVRTESSIRAKELLKIGMPVIAVATMQEMLNLPYISADAELIARMAGEYYLKKRFENFAFFGLTEAKWSRERMECFCRFLGNRSHKVHVFEGDQKSTTSAVTSFIKIWISSTTSAGQRELTSWLKQLPKPVAILASCDIFGCHLINVAKDARLSIPEEIAVLGIQNDEAMCKICDPPLSSIALDFKKAGYNAAQFLDTLICGNQTMQGQCIRIEPTHVETRSSTDVFAVDDPVIVQALKYIRQNSDKPLQVSDISNHVCVSKRCLQMKFAKALGRSIHEEIVQSHFEIAKSLLVEKDLSIDEIALQSGFHYTSNMRRAFKQITGLLPQHYRQLHHAN